MIDERGNYRCDYCDLAEIGGMENVATGNHVSCERRVRIIQFEKVARGLVEYRRMNTLNFQLEKADHWINQLAALLPKEPKV
jgi:hypothetical protein